MQSRYYSPEIGRFINADEQLGKIGGILTHNAFIYCLNNPITASDPDGHFFMLLTAAIGAVVGAAVGAAVAAATGGNVLAGAAIGAVAGGLIGLTCGAAAGVVLAGSATASTAAVMTGGGALVTTVGGGGLVAGGKMLADNVSQAVSRTPQVFWSGGEKAMNAAQQVAREVGGKTINMTRLGQYLGKINASDKMWDAASKNFANTVNNVAYTIQNGAGVRIASTWARIEYPILQAKKALLIFGVVID